MAGRGAGVDGGVAAGRSAPARGFLGVVAGFAESLAVVGGGGSAVGVPGGVVEVADRGVAPGGAAGLVAQDQEPASPPVKGRRRESIATSARCGAGVEPAQPTSAVGCRRSQVAGPAAAGTGP